MNFALCHEESFRGDLGGGLLKDRQDLARTRRTLAKKKALLLSRRLKILPHKRRKSYSQTVFQFWQKRESRGRGRRYGGSTAWKGKDNNEGKRMDENNLYI